MDVNWDAFKFWLDFIVWVIAMFVAIAAWVRSGSNKNKETIDQAQGDIHRLDKRIQAVETLAKAAPTHEDIARLREQTSELDSKLDGMQNTLNLIHQYLLNKKD
ncbi:hypothetical protein [Neptuniibacter marinus]|uniref:hypothetical protein n=1 Tax=Neptuniibacter marinus TaxID=1806670 RepID=UPI003B5CA016